MKDRKYIPLIVGFVADLISITRIESVAEDLGYQVAWFERFDEIPGLDLGGPVRQLGEHTHGPGAALLEQLTDLRPALIIFDLSNQAVPWRELVALIKSAPATRRLPVLCFGPHKDVEAIRAARQAGADVVLARSRFVSDLPALIQKYSRQPDIQAIEQACLAPLTALAIRGLELFNQGEFFEAHEVLEDAWNEDSSPGRELYRAILQVAVAYLQIERENYNGAVKMFLRVRQWIDPLPDNCRGVDVAALRADASLVHQALIELGPERISEFNHGLFGRVQYQII
jgi:CheY-like chemotaxis protein